LDSSRIILGVAATNVLHPHLMLVFLALNGCDLEFEVKDMVEMVLAVESDRWKVDEIEDWLRPRTAVFNK
jgi:prophage maintenance system killer protein